MSFRLNTSLFSDDEVNVDDMDESNSEDNVSYKHLFNSAILDLNAEDSTFADDSDTESGTSMNNSDDHSSASDSEVPVSEACDDDDDDDDGDGEEEEKTINEAVEQTLNVQPLATPIVPEGPQYGPHFKLSRGEELYAYEEELKIVKEKKFICSLDLFLDLFVKRCPVLFCNNSPNVKHHFVGPTLVVHTTCQAGHRYSFASSHEVNGMYVNNLQCASALLLSGNNYSKISRMAEFLNLNFISESTYYRMQRLYLVPAVEEWWCWMRGELIKEFEGQKIVVGGDGQCDSPGFSAKNLCYFLMEITTSYILKVEVRDKRHVGLTSTRMEKEALKNALERLKSVLDVVELATDASASIKKLIEINFKDVFHSLDVWHKSKSIRKCLAKIGQSKKMQKIKAWSDHIIKHFWHCSSVCKQAEASDKDALKIMKDKWIGLLHHVCNEHDWDGGKCDYDNNSHDPDLQWFDRRHEDFKELQKVILNPELLASFSYYVRFRHTGSIECANSLSLVYTPKRTPLSYRAFKARKYLTAIDWNYHLHLNPATSKSGNQIVSRKYNQRTQQWDVRVVKQNKGYEYIPLLTAKIVNSRMHDASLITRNVSLNESDPRLLAPTIAAKPPPPINELMKRKSRFTPVSGTSTSVDKKSSDIDHSTRKMQTEGENSNSPLPMEH